MTIEDVMVSRADSVALSATAPLEEVVAAVEHSRHAHLPVLEKHLDRIVVMIRVKDVPARIGEPNTPALKALAREVLFVSPAMPVLDLLLETRLKRTRMALIVDGFGGRDGLATIGDPVEEIVGDIEDEHHIAEPPHLEARPDGPLVADAGTTLGDFNAADGDVLTDDEREDRDTLGGLGFNLLGRVPSRGELVSHPSGLESEVLDGDPRRLKRLRPRNPPADE